MNAENAKFDIDETEFEIIGIPGRSELMSSLLEDVKATFRLKADLDERDKPFDFSFFLTGFWRRTSTEPGYPDEVVFEFEGYFASGSASGFFNYEDGKPFGRLNIKRLNKTRGRG